MKKISDDISMIKNRARVHHQLNNVAFDRIALLKDDLKRNKEEIMRLKGLVYEQQETINRILTLLEL